MPNKSFDVILRGLNQEEAKLTTQFEEDILAETNNGAVVVDNKAELDGMSEADIAGAAATAKERLPFEPAVQRGIT